jgi:simple sugar transport system ATP-binding protein
MNSAPIVEARNIVKRYGPTVAIDDVSISLQTGQVMCLLGDNGAGKSTLIKVISGVEQPSQGSLLVDGTPVRFANPGESRAGGIATVYQSGGTIPLMSVGRNFFVGAEYTKGRWPFRRLDLKRSNEIALAELRELGLTRIRDADQLVGSLSGGERQALTIARAMYFGARVLILDEPTSSLGIKEASMVLRLIARARARGVAVLFITHNATHALTIGDTFTVLIHGKVADAWSRGERAREDVLNLMAGGEELAELEANLDSDTF